MNRSPPSFHVEVVDANPLCLARISRFCRKLHRAPRFGVDPEGYLDHVIRLLSEDRFDVLFPAHEQAYLFACFHDRLSLLTHIALPDFEVFERLQSKVGFAGVLAELDLPSPPTVIAFDERTLRYAANRLPVGQSVEPRDVGTEGVRSFMGIQALLGAARDSGSRGAVARAMFDRARHRGIFAQGTEELTPHDDLPSAIVLAAVGIALLVKPALWQKFSSSTVKAYAATPRVVEFVHRRSARAASRSAT